ncbi:MAG: hypothetical protein LC803_08910 [Acidobacteria bacterium]|nr:hypothetical protein [Acidobacteriota bacterium]
MMNLREIKCSVSTLKPKQLVKLDVWLHTLLEARELMERERQNSRQREILEANQTTHKSYRLESIRCGKKGCKCAEGNLHGPYWYAYWKEKGKSRSQYIGKRLPNGIKLGQDAAAREVQ